MVVFGTTALKSPHVFILLQTDASYCDVLVFIAYGVNLDVVIDILILLFYRNTPSMLHAELTRFKLCWKYSVTFHNTECLFFLSCVKIEVAKPLCCWVCARNYMVYSHGSCTHRLTHRHYLQIVLFK